MKKIIKKLIVWILTLSFFIEATPVYALVKEETIYAKLNSNGTISSTSVYEHLYGSNDDVYKDKSLLNNITNVNGDEKYSKKDNEITWEAKGNDIYYNGTTDKDLPISLDIKYYLDGKEYEAKDMLGKEGKVKIVLNYENKLKHQVIVNNKIETLYTPFVVATTSLLSNDNNKNIKVSSGKVIDNGNTSIIVGLSSPGLYESLDLNELKGLDTLEITYDTTSFELSSLYAVATSKLIGEDDLDILNNIKSLYSGINALQENMDLLVDGSRKLANGTNEFNNAISDISDKYHYYRNLNTQDVVNMVKPILNNAIENSIPKLKEKAKEEIDNAVNNLQPEMIEAIANAALNSTQDVIEGEIDRILDEVDLEDYITNIIGQDLIDSFTSDPQIQSLALQIISAISDAYNTEISVVTNNALNSLINSINVNMSYDERQAYINSIATEYDIPYEKAALIVDKVQTDTVNKIKQNIQSNSSNITLNITNNVINNITSEEHLDIILNQYVAGINNLVTEIASNESINEYKEELKNNIANYIKEELAKKDLIERYTESSEYINSIVNEIIDKTADTLSETYFTGMTSDAIKQLLNEELNKYSLKDELESIINNINTKLNIVDEKVDLLTSSVALINNGAKELADGLYMYNEQGIKKISNLVNGDVKSLTGKVEALVKLSNDYKTLDDINNNYEGKSKIIFMIDSLKKVEEKKSTTQTTIEKETIWDKIKGLFK